MSKLIKINKCACGFDIILNVRVLYLCYRNSELSGVAKGTQPYTLGYWFIPRERRLNQ